MLLFVLVGIKTIGITTQGPILDTSQKCLDLYRDRFVVHIYCNNNVLGTKPKESTIIIRSLKKKKYYKSNKKVIELKNMALFIYQYITDNLGWS